MRSGLAATLAACAVLMTGPGEASPSYQVLDWSDLKGWEADEHDAALAVFLETCPDLTEEVWSSICAVASRTEAGARTFFELFFRPVLVSDGNPALFTGYFEPELEASRTRTERFRYPIYRLPPEVPVGEVWFSRAEIETGGLLDGRDLELAWLADPVDAFFLQVQGSGRLRFTDGGGMRLGYGGTNGHKYRSIGQELVRRGVYEPHQVSAAVIRNWVRRNPGAGRDLLHHNPAFIFFREVRDVPVDRGPLGAMNRSVTEMRTIAVDPAFVPLGAPVWIEKGGKRPMNRLMVAQDTGSAIKGAQRADIFFGTGPEAGRRAGQVRDPGRMVVLMPIPLAYELAPEG